MHLNLIELTKTAIWSLKGRIMEYGMQEMTYLQKTV